MRMVEKSLLLQILDQNWKEHLLTLDHLRQGIILRAYAQRDPLNEYKSEAFGLFEKMLNQLRENVTSVLCQIELQVNQPSDLELPRLAQSADAREPRGSRLGRRRRTAAMMTGHGNRRAARPRPPSTPPIPATWGKVSRNAPCPCGSGRKYKQCHGKLT